MLRRSARARRHASRLRIWRPDAEKRSNLEHEPGLLAVCLQREQHKSRCARGIFVFYPPPPPTSLLRLPLHLTLAGSAGLEGVQPAPLSGNPLHAAISRRGRADALNFNHNGNIEFVELLKMYLSNKMLPIPFDMESCCSSLLHELNYFSCLYSGAARGSVTLIT